MSQDWVDFREIKQKITMEMVLIHYQLLGTLRQTARGFKGPCPIHKGSHGNQFHVDPVKNRWNCFGGCDMEKLEGHVIGFVAAMEQVSLRDAALLIAQWYSLSTSPPARPNQKSGRGEKAPSPRTKPEKEKAIPPPEQERPIPGEAEPESDEPENKELTFELKSLSTNHPFFTERGIAPETINLFGLGLCSKGMMKDRIIFPIHRRDGKLIGYTGRTTLEVTDENPKWLLPPGLIKPKVLFNFHRVAGRSDTVIIVEGPLDLVAVHQVGFPNVVALLGKELLEDETLSYDQARLLTNQFEKAVILLDGDKDGRERSLRCLQKLAPRMFVRLVTLPADQDPSDIPPEELRKLLSFTQ
ncbi:MAG: toprim domain-containing protein [Syntrophobacteraceae bacterium]